MGNSSDSDIGYGIKLCDDFVLPWNEDPEKRSNIDEWWFCKNNDRKYNGFDELDLFLKNKPVPVNIILNGSEGEMEPVICIPSTVKSSDWNKIEKIEPATFFHIPSDKEKKEFWNFFDTYIRPIVESEDYEFEDFDLTLKWYWVNSWG